MCLSFFIYIFFSFFLPFVFNRLNMQNVYMLTKMQYPQAAAAEALKQTNNDVGRALDVRLLIPSLPHLVKFLD